MTSKPTEMELRVAKAAYESVYDDGWDNAYEGHQEMCLTAARAAIRAMREPTFRMIDEGATSSDETCMYPEDVWNAMIDAASPQEE
jgi:hypothetical protein